MFSNWSLYLFCMYLSLHLNFGKLQFNAFSAATLTKLSDNDTFVPDMLNMWQQNGTSSSHISVRCKEDIDHLFNISKNVSDMSTFGELQMIDSNGRWPAGIMEGNVFWMGDFTQCVKSKVWKIASDNESRTFDFKGKYCIHDLNEYFSSQLVVFTKFSLFMTNGICVPSSCSHTDAESLINQYIFPFHTKVTEEMCQIEDPPDIDWLTTALFVAIGMLIAVILLATSYDVVDCVRNKFKIKESKRLNKSNAHRILLAFSAYTNTIKLLDTSVVKEEPLSCIYGLKVISVTLVVAGHVLITILVHTSGIHNRMIYWTALNTWWHQPFIYARFTVDTFLCITGFLITYGSMKVKMDTGRFSILGLYFTRMWRITPTFIFVILLAMGPFQAMGKGPLWESNFVTNKEHCRKNLWKKPLYINAVAVLSEADFCFIHTWYVNVDMFFVLTCPIILYPIMNEHWSGPVIWMIILISIIAAEIPFSYLIQAEHFIGLSMNMDNFMKYLSQIYVKPWFRAPSFLIGMAFGYFYFKFGYRLNLTKEQVFIGWSVAITIIISYIYGNYPYSSETVIIKPSQFAQSMFISVAPVAWSVAVGWIILACATGYGGVINSILSWKFFIPIARFSYSTYLSHAFPILYFAKTRKDVLYLDESFLVCSCFGMVFVCLVFGWIINVLIERPFSELEHIIKEKIKCLTITKTKVFDETRISPRTHGLTCLAMNSEDN